jgi:uncharacterized protein
MSDNLQGLAVVGLGVIGLAITAWVFWPAFHGPQAARAAIGSHRLALGALVSVVIMNAAITLPLAPYLRVEQGFTSTSFLAAALSTEIPMLIFLYVRLIMPGAVTWSDLGVRPRRVDYVLRMGLGLGLVGLIVIDIVGTLLSQIGLRPNQLEQFNFILSEGPLAFVLMLVAAGLFAPVVEELFFRGFLFGLYRWRQSLWVAYLVSSVLFTLLHLEPTRMNLPQMAGLGIGIFGLAMLLAWMYQHTGSLFPGIVAHAVNNATGLILFYALGVR